MSSLLYENQPKDFDAMLKLVDKLGLDKGKFKTDFDSKTTTAELSEEINNAENTFVLETGTDDKKSFVKFDKGAIYQTAPAEGSAVAQQKVEEKAPEEPFEEASKEEVPKAPKSNKKPRAKKAAAPKAQAPAEEVAQEASDAE